MKRKRGRRKALMFMQVTAFSTWAKVPSSFREEGVGVQSSALSYSAKFAIIARKMFTTSEVSLQWPGAEPQR
jgi:hypothetical protein